MADCYGIYGEPMDSNTVFRRANVAMMYYKKYPESGKKYRKYCTEEELQDLKGFDTDCKFHTKSIKLTYNWCHNK